MIKRYLLSGLFTSALVAGGALAASQPAVGWTNASPTPNGGSPQSTCAAFSSLSATFTAAPGATNGIIGLPQLNDSYTISVSGPGTGSFRIVGDGAGVVTYAGPASVPGTLTYTVTNPVPPSGALGAGYYFDSGSGTVTLTASCGTVSQLPSISTWGMSLMALLLAVGGAVALTAVNKRRQA
ncbi:hypothetical protein ELE36_12630 [Pseudolysobacter antarcticus]|uniref:IPTL-CTERM sorting domain-containing protein n=1 Tax=Pseudolysobacter antarcticus TaxID=2511995 RepID=A0A411HKT0_9GAMM|nr:hypothetical protein [Pseudolysobacter antarcticus]QBB71129.1 hypothetical protein ELE36_12630 [Pseudolysobacter antarcticus]